MYWLIVGITGVTCSGKSTLAVTISDYVKANHQEFPAHIRIGSVQIIKQDDYFYPKTYQGHTWLPEFNYINREILSALNMTKMLSDIETTLGADYRSYTSKERSKESRVLNILIIEGFLIFNHQEIRDICQIKLDIRLSYEECFRRRQHRKYNPPNPPGYFEKVIWPFYLKHFSEYNVIPNLHVLDGESSKDSCLRMAMDFFRAYL